MCETISSMTSHSHKRALRHKTCCITTHFPVGRATTKFKERETEHAVVFAWLLPAAHHGELTALVSSLKFSLCRSFMSLKAGFIKLRFDKLKARALFWFYVNVIGQIENK